MTNYILIPTFNEEQNIELLANNIKSTLLQSNVYYVFVDDSSTDNTVDMIERFFKNNNFTIIKKEKKIGPGDSFNKGFNWILSHSTNDDDIVITMEADNTSDISILMEMISISKLGYDIVLASVYAQGGGFSKTSFTRKIISFFANLLFRSIFNIKVLTLSSFYRVYKISILRKIKQYFSIIIAEKGFISMLEILLKSVKLNARVIEVPMILKSDIRKGKSKMKIFKNSISYVHFFLKYKK